MFHVKLLVQSIIVHCTSSSPHIIHFRSTDSLGNFGHPNSSSLPRFASMPGTKLRSALRPLEILQKLLRSPSAPN